VIKNQAIIDRIEKYTAGDKKMENLVRTILDDESEGKYFAKSGKVLIEKEAKEREARGI